MFEIIKQKYSVYHQVTLLLLTSHPLPLKWRYLPFAFLYESLPLEMPYFWYVPRTVGCAVVAKPDDDIWISSHSSQISSNCYQIITIDICSRNIDQTIYVTKTILST